MRLLSHSKHTTSTISMASSSTTATPPTGAVWVRNGFSVVTAAGSTSPSTGAVTRWSNQRPVDGEVVGQLSAAYHVILLCCTMQRPQPLRVDVPQIAVPSLRTMRTSSTISPQRTTTTQPVGLPRNGSSQQAVSGSSSPRKATCTNGRTIPTHQQAHSSQSLVLKCKNTEPLTEAAAPQAGQCGAADVNLDLVAQNIDAELKFNQPNNYFTNWAGEGEKWLEAGNGRWFYMLPNGELYLWDVESRPITGRLVATLSAEFHANPALLHDASN